MDNRIRNVKFFGILFAVLSILFWLIWISHPSLEPTFKNVALLLLGLAIGVGLFRLKPLARKSAVFFELFFVIASFLLLIVPSFWSDMSPLEYIINYKNNSPLVLTMFLVELIFGLSVLWYFSQSDIKKLFDKQE
jgi:peptidoglycan/LPS O-acetylase OafA/YrhL